MKITQGEPIQFEDCQLNIVPCPPPPIFSDIRTVEDDSDKNNNNKDKVKEDIDGSSPTSKGSLFMQDFSNKFSFS